MVIRRKKEEGRRKKEEGRRKKEEGRRQTHIQRGASGFGKKHFFIIVRASPLASCTIRVVWTLVRSWIAD